MITPDRMTELLEHVITDSIIQDMIGWLCDCQWPDITEEEIQDLNYPQVLKAIERHFAGGVNEFLLTLNQEV